MLPARTLKVSEPGHPDGSYALSQPGPEVCLSEGWSVQTAEVVADLSSSWS